jgi:hypothetical protein
LLISGRPSTAFASTEGAASLEAAVLVEEEPPQAARAPAAAIVPETFRKLRREIFFIILFSFSLGVLV